MIILYSGTPGSGKSLHMAKDLSDAWTGNRPIVGNFPLNTENLDKSSIFKKKNIVGYYYLNNFNLCPRKLYEYSQKVFSKDGFNHKYKEGHILLVIDECQLLFNSRDFQKQGRMEWLEFFTQHRKFGYDVILVAQFDRMIDRQIRCLIETEFEHRKVSSFGWFGQITSIIGSKNVFCIVEKYYPLNERLKATFFMKKKKYYSIYDTNYKFNIN